MNLQIWKWNLGLCWGILSADSIPFALSVTMLVPCARTLWSFQRKNHYWEKGVSRAREVAHG